MQRLAAGGGGSSQCVDRLLVLTEPAQLDAGEITDKSYVNQAAVRDRRAALAAQLTAEPRPAHVVVRWQGRAGRLLDRAPPPPAPPTTSRSWTCTAGSSTSR